MARTVIQNMASYELKGNKLSFAEWVSNISPTETPFTSMTGKEAINQTKFQWQTDIMPAPKKDNACQEGSAPTFDDIASTTVTNNTTQIFRRAVSVSDTANAVAYYGRSKEIGYQMEKASLELKRDIEVALLSDQVSATAASGVAGKTAAFQKLCLTEDATDADTSAKLVFKTGSDTDITEAKLFEMTYNLYLANSKANIVMFHPKHAAFFSTLVEVPAGNVAAAGSRMKMFGAMDDEYNAEVDTFIDPLGQKFALVPNRHMPEGSVYFFNPSDWTQMVLRAPKKIKLAKSGSSEEWMVECELGLRHRNKAASGILLIKA